MKQVIYVLSLLALVSCKDIKKQESTIQTDAVEAANNPQHDEASNVYGNSWTENMVMNHGEKWQANAETNEGVANMINSLNTQITNTLDDYHQLAKLLNEDKNDVIKNCTMQGPSHDNLHVWLLPLMAKIEALSESKTVSDASIIKKNIEENIHSYSDYFQ